MINISSKTCSICLESLDETDLIFHSGANGKKHPFHRLCIDPWLQRYRSCPMCKIEWNYPHSSQLSLKDKFVTILSATAVGISLGLLWASIGTFDSDQKERLKESLPIMTGALFFSGSVLATAYDD